jgi:hypothetical protein
MSSKLKWTLLVGAFLIIGIVAMVVGFAMTGYDILGWFSTKYAFITYFFVGGYALFLAWVLVQDYVMRR